MANVKRNNPNHRMGNSRRQLTASILLMLLGLALCGCHAQQSPNPLEPDQAKALEAYKKQQHRFELRECKLYYNGTQLIFYDSLTKFERLFGKNYIEDFGELYFKDVPMSLDIEWANLDDRLKGKPGSDNDNTRIVNSMLIHFGLPEDIDTTYGHPDLIQRRVLLNQQKMLNGFIMMDSILINADTDVDFINREYFKKNQEIRIHSKYGDHKFLGYTYYYPDITDCTPIREQSLPTSTYISIIRDDNNKLRDLNYSYSINDRPPAEEVEKKLNQMDSLINGKRKKK